MSTPDDLNQKLNEVMDRLQEFEATDNKQGQFVVDLSKSGLTSEQQAQVRDAMSEAAKQRLQSIGADPDYMGTYSYSR